ncbi:hypothetical protein CTheo_2948 [Ceratobasidium theobromae]|uniref:Extracellular mutant protein 11 C-terminal domain-containing protein n=1 Tax=Ceratobasidium theobromae TaxID=1582974 RepID=A0A5N5QPF4_9AGAM|nr:hypothetical protein CTheo_2948 [Ceratobasidium theobromae]
MSSRRFTPAQRKTAPTTPRGTSRVLPTPPTSATPSFRPAQDDLHRNTDGVNLRNGEGIASRSKATPTQPDLILKLPIGRFSKNKNPQSDISGSAVHGQSSPARRTRAQVHGTPERELARPHRIFGQGNGILPLSPLPPPLLNRPSEQTAPSHFSSPTSSPENGHVAENTAPNDPGNPHDVPDTSGAHTSTTSIFNQVQGASSALAEDDTLYRHTFQAHSGPRRVSVRGQAGTTGLQDELDEPPIESPSPTTYAAKRRAGDHNAQVASKRVRSALNQGFDEDHYGAQEQEAEHPSTAQYASQTLPRGYYSPSLDMYIEAHQTEWIAAQKRWENCTMEEWQSGPRELSAELDKIMDMVRVYASINKDVQIHKAHLDARDALLAKEKDRLVKQAGGLAGGVTQT